MAKPHHHRPNKKPDSPAKGGSYWMYGTHACDAAIVNPNRQIKRILATRNAASRLSHPAIDIVEPREIERIVGEEAVHQGIAMLVEPLQSVELEEAATGKATLIMLDQVTDPHNVGAILRSAAAFGVAGVITPKDHAASESATLAKSACGAVDMVPLISVTNLVQSIEILKKCGYWVAGLDGEATHNISDVAKFKPLCLIMGAEGKGLRRLTRDHCDTLLKIPMDSRMESLNVSNAAAIALYEAFRLP